MSDLLERKVKSIKNKLDQIKSEIVRLDKEESAGLLSPLERMRLASLKEEKKELNVKLRELLM
ncbi:hypothetical protein AMJ80_04840 [bacterium SM23_31]|nr:MAG: hypothetical protein AMJ80_04840 [bacterium SM23_31]